MIRSQSHLENQAITTDFMGTDSMNYRDFNGAVGLSLQWGLQCLWNGSRWYLFCCSPCCPCSTPLHMPNNTYPQGVWEDVPSPKGERTSPCCHYRSHSKMWYKVMEEDFTLCGEHTVQYTDDVL